MSVLGSQVFGLALMDSCAMDQKSLIEGYIANFGISLDVFEFLCFG